MTAIRIAAPLDAEWALRRVEDGLAEAHLNGSEVIAPSAKTTAWCRSLIERAVNGDESVILLVSYPVAISLAIDATPPWESDHDKTMAGIVTYVAPEARRNGWSTRMRSELIAECARRGFKTLLGSVTNDDKAALESLRSVPGIKMHQQTFYVRCAP